MSHHLPIRVDCRRAENNANIVKLAQDSFVTYYSTRRKTPLFVAERLNGHAVRAWRKYREVRNLLVTIYVHVCIMHVINTFN